MSITTYETWPVDYPCDTQTLDQTRLATATLFAQRVMWGLSGRRVGVALTEDEAYRVPTNGLTCAPPADLAEWRGRSYGTGGHCCSIPLHHAPVLSIEAVRLDGVAMQPTEYRLEAGHLMRVGGCWPRVAACDEPVIVVDYRWGIPPDGAAAIALGEFACELMAGWNGQACRLPNRLVGVARQGVTQQFESVEALLRYGRLGLPMLDEWLRLLNPNRLQERSRVYSPDVARRA